MAVGGAGTHGSGLVVSLRPQSAQALVEFALTSTVILLLLVGGIDLGRVFYFDVVAGAAAMEGARAAASGLPDSDGSNPTVTSTAQATAPSWLGPSLVVTTTPTESARVITGGVPPWT